MQRLTLSGPTAIDEDLTGTAVFSEFRNYRYALSRDWYPEGRIVVWIMLNPSIGDDKILEQTTAGCMKRTKMWGFSGMVVLNLFALVSTNPDQLKNHEDPVGPMNDLFINESVREAPSDTVFIAAWGNHGKLHNRDKEVVKLLNSRHLYCLGTNKDGSPRHPLHMAHSIRPELWRGAGDSRL